GGQPRDIAEPGRSRLRASHRAVHHRARRCLRFHGYPRKRAACDPVSPRWKAHSRADRGHDLPVPRGAWWPQHPRRRAGTASVRLEVAVVCATTDGMHHQTIRHGRRIPALALALLAPPALAAEPGALPPAAGAAMAQMASPQAISEYRRKLREYQEARAAFEAEAGAYWSSISEKRKVRNAKRRERQTIALDDYVLTQPPVYSGPKRPVNPEPEEEKPPRERKPIPVVADFLKAAADHFQFVPQRPAGEVDFKRAYARYALAAGLTREQAVRVYSFETGGTGNHDMQSGLSASRPGSRAISTAIGYNPLPTTHSVE